MYGVSRHTYKDLVDDALRWTGDESDSGQMRELVKQAVRASHERRLTLDRYSFMLFPKTQSFTTVNGQQAYSLHEAFLSPSYFWNVTQNRPVKTIAQQRLSEFQSDRAGSLATGAIQGVGKVQNQPASAGTITATSSDVADNNKQVIVVGETATGIEQEVLTVGGGAGSVVFLPFGILDVIKLGDEWTGTLTLTAADSTVLLQLAAAQYGRQFRQFYAATPQAGGDVIAYQFYRQPKQLTYDTDIPDIPYPFDRILTLDALVSLAGITRPSEREVKQWKQEIIELEHGLAMHYADGQSADSEPQYQQLVAR